MKGIILAGTREILIISTPDNISRFETLLGNGTRFGIDISYVVQPSTDGLAQAFIIGEEFIGNDTCALVLGDNIFYGNGFSDDLKRCVDNTERGFASVFGYYVSVPERFGVVEFDDNQNVISVEEKPISPRSNYAITGLYFYPKGVSVKAKKIRPSERGGLEITELNDLYLENKLKVELLGRGYTWLDTGTIESLSEATEFIHKTEKRQGVKISAPEEIAYRYKWIDKATLLKSAEKYGKYSYGVHLKAVAEDKYFTTVC